MLLFSISSRLMEKHRFIKLKSYQIIKSKLIQNALITKYRKLLSVVSLFILTSLCFYSQVNISTKVYEALGTPMDFLVPANLLVPRGTTLITQGNKGSTPGVLSDRFCVVWAEISVLLHLYCTACGSCFIYVASAYILIDSSNLINK